MNAYGFKELMGDYVFLEDIGRKVGGWGQNIAKLEGGYGSTASGTGFAERMRGSSRGRGRGRGRGGTGIGQTRTKRDTLKMQLDLRDIEMEVLPLGMEKRKANQSTWDFRLNSRFFQGFVYLCTLLSAGTRQHS
jgi:hypothetical protein